MPEGQGASRKDRDENGPQAKFDATSKATVAESETPPLNNRER